MEGLKKIIFFVLFLCLSAAFISQDAECLWRRPSPGARAKAQNKTLKSKREYNYVQNHDLNGDGVVNNRDRLIWLNRYRGNYQSTLVSTENEDMVEVMDINGDGKAEAWEMENFYNLYDTNKNGILDPEEINAVKD